MSYPDYDFHEFLMRDGELSDLARELPLIREYMDSLPKTAATFNVGKIDAIEKERYTAEHFEFVGSWPVHPMYRSGRAMKYVNPDYVHVRQYSDFIVECECGARVARNFKDGLSVLDRAHQHTDECTPYQRLQVRADLGRLRHQEVLRLTRLGWKGPLLGKRAGMSRTGLTDYTRECGVDLMDQRDEYRRIAGNTFTFLVYTTDATVDEVGEVYGHTPATLRKWTRAYSDFTYEAERSRGLVNVPELNDYHGIR